MKKQIILTILISISLIVLISASNIPLPHAFEGNVYYSDGVLIGKNLELRAEINGYESSCSLVNGKYNLVVKSESENETIYFYIEGLTKPIGNYTFVSFEITELDFKTTLTNPDTTPVSPPPNNNNDGGDSPGGGSPSSNNPIIILNKTTDTDAQTTNEENETIGLNGNQEPTNPGIIGAVIGFIKTGGGLIILIFSVLIIVIGLGVIVMQKKHKTSKNDE